MKYVRYVYLDGIRGIAALFVLTRHTPSFWDMTFFRSYLAVDVFFLLSGFVIANAYQKKMEKGELSISQFALIRLIRFYPLFLFSLLISTVNYSLHPMDVPILNVILTILLTIFFIPSMLINQTLFSLNSPYWSLFFELIANALYAVTRPFLTTKNLLLVIMASGLLVVQSAHYNNDLNIGFTWGLMPVIGGFARAIYGIFLGILIQNNLHHIQTTPRPALAISMVVLTFTLPSLGIYNFIFDVFALLFIFPTSIMLAITTEENYFSNIFMWLGMASYPLYVLHLPVSGIIDYFYHDIVSTSVPYSGLLLILFLVPLSIFIEEKMDKPIRKALTHRFFHPLN